MPSRVLLREAGDIVRQVGLVTRRVAGVLVTRVSPGRLLVHWPRLDLLISRAWIISNLALSTHYNVISISLTSVTSLPFTSIHSISCCSHVVRIGYSHIRAHTMVVTLFTTHSSSSSL